MPGASARRRAAIADVDRSLLLSGFEIFTIVATSLVACVVYHEAVLGFLGPVDSFFGAGLLVALLFSGTMKLLHSERRIKTIEPFYVLREAAFVWASVCIFVLFIAFAFKVSSEFSRGASMAFFLSGFPAIAFTRLIAPQIASERFGIGSLDETHVLILGADGQPQLQELVIELNSLGCTNIAVVAVDAAADNTAWPDELRRCLSESFNRARTSDYGGIYVAGSGLAQERLSALLSGLQPLPRAVYLVPDRAVERLLEFQVRGFGNRYALEFQHAPLTRRQRIVKRALDLAVAAPLAIILMPLFLGIGIAIKLETRGPALFRQRRLGYRSAPFSILKFRTLTVTEDGADVLQVSKSDRRVTRIGKWLRRLSIDELPQVFNVLMGDMSLVGPRPHAEAHDELYSTLIENYQLRQHVKPGITGWAQIHGYRGETPTVDIMRRRIELDIWYAKNASVSLDIQILFRTILEVLRQRNAY